MAKTPRYKWMPRSHRLSVHVCRLLREKKLDADDLLVMFVISEHAEDIGDTRVFIGIGKDDNLEQSVGRCLGIPTQQAFDSLSKLLDLKLTSWNTVMGESGFSIDW